MTLSKINKVVSFFAAIAISVSVQAQPQARPQAQPQARPQAEAHTEVEVQGQVRARESLRLLYWGFSQQALEHAHKVYKRLWKMGLRHPKRLESFSIDNNQSELQDFEALFIPGGHAPMVDLLYQDIFTGRKVNEHIGRILYFFHRHQRTTALICHASAALAAAPSINGKWIYSGYKMTTVTTLFEWLNEDLPFFKSVSGHVAEYPRPILRNAGGILKQNPLPMIPRVVEYKELLTGQDPFAVHLFASALVRKIRRNYVDPAFGYRGN